MSEMALFLPPSLSLSLSLSRRSKALKVKNPTMSANISTIPGSIRMKRVIINKQVKESHAFQSTAIHINLSKCPGQ